MKKVVIIVFLLAILLALGFIFFTYWESYEDVNKTIEKYGDENLEGEKNGENESLNEDIDINNTCLDLGCSKSTKYVGSINSDKYYRCECPWSKNINPENLICFQSGQEARAMNYTKSEC